MSQNSFLNILLTEETFQNVNRMFNRRIIKDALSQITSHYSE